MSTANHLAKLIFVLWIIFTVQPSQLTCADDSESASTTPSTSTTKENKLKSIIPDCVFGVESLSFVQVTRDNPRGRIINETHDRIHLRTEKVSFVIHGFVSEANNTNNYKVAQNWLERENITVYLLDWSDAACTTNGFSLTNLLAYRSAVKNVRPVAKRVARFTIRLIEEYGVALENIYVVGHSLGAHIAGFTGKAIQTELQQSLYYLIALDPAAPLFEHNACEERLCETDAVHLQTFHTSILGMQSNIGGIDIFFVAGAKQPGCVSPVCDHSRAVEYFGLSLKPDCVFIGTRWKKGTILVLPQSKCTPESCCHVGLDAFHTNATGVYNVIPKLTYPYCNAK